MKQQSALFFLVIFGLMGSSFALAQDLNASEQFDESEQITVLVQLQESPPIEPTQLRQSRNPRFESIQEGIRKQQERAMVELNISSPKSSDHEKLKLERSFSNINVLQLKVTKEGLEQLQNDPNIKSIHFSQKFTALLSDTKEHVNATATWRLKYNNTNLTGLHQTVCVIDTGVDYTHPNMGGCSATSNINDKSCAKVIGGYDFVNNDANPIDDDGHGTHVAGIVASTDATYRGIAPDAKIAALKVLDEDGAGFDSDIIAAIDWCVSNATALNITVITMSLGGSDHFSGHCDDNQTLMTQAISAAIARNISVIAAAGNSGLTSGIVLPACIKNVTAVSWATKTNQIETNADRNNLTDLIAPGTSIRSLQASGTTACSSGSPDSSFITCSGSSMATPHVAGAAALVRQYGLLQLGRKLTANETEYFLNTTGKLITDTGLQYSRIDLFAAIQSLDATLPIVSLLQPSNNSIRNNISFLIQINASETIIAATLEINGTNTSMSESNQLWSANISFLQNGSYFYRIYSNDSFQNKNSQLFSILIDTISPRVSSLAINNSNPRYNDTIQLNFLVNDTTSLSSIIFSWNQSGSFSNETMYPASGQQFNLSINKTINRTKNTVIGVQFFVNDSVNNFNVSNLLVFSVSNSLPQAINITLNSSDPLNRTNATIFGFYSFFDADNDSINGTQLRWYKNGVEQTSLRNLTNISAQNTTKNDRWNFSVSVFDGESYGPFINTTIVIRNSAPSINITISSISVNETQKINITLNASDPDFDTLNFTANNSRLLNQSIYLIWNTNLSDAGTYVVNITVNDTGDIDWHIVTITVSDARDLDNDGNPDFNETDDDNDGILDVNDFTSGNISNINSTVLINVSINNTANVSKLFNGTFAINISNGTRTIVAFNFTFNESSTFDFGSITFNKTSSGSSAISIQGINLSTSENRKTIILEKRNNTADAVCIKDSEAGFETISSACNSNDELLLSCDNSSSSGYSCLDDGSFYTITGLAHSAIKEQCTDSDGDAYGSGCSAGSDCDDNDASKQTTCSSGGSGGGGGGGSGGGGGGGASTSKIVNYDKMQTYAEVAQGSEIVFSVNKDHIAVSSIAFTPNKKLSKVTLKIQDLEENESEEFDGIAYQYLEIASEGMKESDLQQAIISFSVDTSWIIDNEINSSKILLYRLQNKTWYSLPTYLISSNKTNILFESTTPGFSHFVIGGQKQKEAFVEEPDLESNSSDQSSIHNETLTLEQAQDDLPSKNSHALLFAILIAIGLALALTLGIIFKRRSSRKKH